MQTTVRMLIFAICVTLMPKSAVSGVSYHFCVSSDVRPGNVVATSLATDLGHEWYKVKTAQAFCQANGASGCTASDFDAATCGSLFEEHIDFYAASGDQVRALFSGNPAIMGQAAVEIYVGVTLDTAKSIGTVIVEGGKKVVEVVVEGWHALTGH
jgi:hypothetical protein